MQFNKLLSTFKEKYWRKSRIYNWGYVERDLWIKQLANQITAGKSILDVGAGTAPYRNLFNHCIYKTHDFAQLKEEQNRAGNNYSKLDYISDIINIPVENKSFDIIICTEVLEHVPEPIKAIQEFSRIIKPGGMVILSAPLAGFVHQEPYHFYGGFSNFWYEKFLTDYNFTNITIEKNKSFFSFYGALSIRFAKYLNPKNIFKNKIMQLMYFPFWMIIVGIFAIIMPAICHILDPLDRTLFTTAGYHVTAIKVS